MDAAESFLVLALLITVALLPLVVLLAWSMRSQPSLSDRIRDARDAPDRRLAGR